MQSSVTQEFRELLSQLPTEVQEQASRAYTTWCIDPYHNSLQFKRVSHRQPIYSARIGIGYRTLGLLENNQIYWFWIGTHAEYDGLLRRL